MEAIKNFVRKRKGRVKSIIDQKSQALKSAPEGTLRIDHSNGLTRCYHRIDPKDPRGKYIPRAQEGLAMDLAQKSYDQKVLKRAEKEWKALSKYEGVIEDGMMEDVYEEETPDRKKWIMPIWQPDKDYVQEWRNYSYQGLTAYDPSVRLRTEEGEAVRSKTEVIIADRLKSLNIPYRYECPAYLDDGGVFYPDFTALCVRTRREYVWEHFGMMDDPVYLEEALKKIERYERNGIFPGDRLITTFETFRSPIDTRIIDLIIRKYLL